MSHIPNLAGFTAYMGAEKAHRSLVLIHYHNSYLYAHHDHHRGNPANKGVSLLSYLNIVNIARLKIDLDARRAFQNPIPHSGISPQFYTGIYAYRSNHDPNDLFAMALAGAAEATGTMSTATPDSMENLKRWVVDDEGCYWVYVVDLDANRFEVYQPAFEGSPCAAPMPSNRFTDEGTGEVEDRLRRGNVMQRLTSTAMRPPMVGSWDLFDLPTQQAFVRSLGDEGGEGAPRGTTMDRFVAATMFGQGQR